MRLNTRYRYFGQWVLFAISVLIFAASFVLKAYFINNTSLDRQSENFERQIRNRVEDFQKTLQDTILINRFATATETKADVLYAFDKPYFFYLYKDGETQDFLRFWNTSQILPPDSIINDDTSTEKFAKLSNGYYYILSQRLPQDTTVTAYCMVLVKSEYFIPTEYFKASYPFNPALDKIVDLSFEPTDYPVKSISGKTLFYLKLKPNSQLQKDNVLSFTLRLLGAFCIFLSLYFFLHRIYTRNDGVKDIYIFIACMLCFRLLLYLGKDIFNFRDFELFDPAIFGSDFFLPNLGDLLINSILFCFVSLLVWNRTAGQELVSKKFLNLKIKWLFGVLMLMVLVFATFTLADIIRKLVADSKISFDVTNFFSLSIYTAVGFIVLAALSLAYYYFTQIVYRFVTRVFAGKEYLVYFLIALMGLVYVTLFANSAAVSFYLPVLVWLLVYTVFFLNEAKINQKFTFNVTGVVVWIFIFSVSISLLMLKEIGQKELLQRKLYAEKLATQKDAATMRLVSLGNKYLDSRFFANNFHRLSNPEQNKFLRDSITGSNYIRYVNNYNTTFYFFDSENQPLFNPTDISADALTTTIRNQSEPTEVPDIYFYSTGFDKFSYITKRVVIDSGKFIGTVFILSEPRKFGDTNINPELFKDYGRWELSNSSVYYYAVYKNKLLVTSSKKYPFTSTLIQSEIPVRHHEVKKYSGFSELWYRPDAVTVVVVARRSEPFLEAITLFSYIFCAFLFLWLVIQFSTLLVDVVFKTKYLKQRSLFYSTIRGQIHSTFILLTVFSFVIVGVATVSFFVNRFQVANNERLGRTMNIVLNELQSHKGLANIVLEQRATNDSVNSSAELADIIKHVSDVHGVDVNIYDISGKLLSSSQPDIYTRGVLSNKLGPRVYYSLLRLRSIEHIQKEKISGLSFTSIYAPVRDGTGAFYAYLGIPYFTSQNELNQEISNFLVTLINLNAFIFLIAGMVALIITNRITRSFKLISDKMNEVSLSRHNELIHWSKNDEIGSLVKEYNRMVLKLKDSADELASSERQVAWQEMAMQVAHEIKNPLTPMKLSLQYLERAINDKRSNIEDLAGNVSRTLVEQIDHLSKIASDFSQFANIGSVTNTVFDLHEVLSQLVQLYQTYDRTEVRWNQLKRVLNVRADKTQVNRLFTNLITNAVDASAGNAQCIIEIHEQLDNNFVIIGIEDNGTGVSDEMMNKIFAPNFTTKTSGTGLGLAMSKVIAEQMGGTIWFKTKVGVGSTFYVRIPLVES